MRLLMLIALLGTVVLLLGPGRVQAGVREWKCSACRAVTDELETKLEEEQPRNHIDMRHRLDKDGKRYGKVIDYKMSELRVIHLLEDLCRTMSKYELVDESDGVQAKQRWARSAELSPGRNVNIEMTKQRRKELENYCHDLLERHEDELSEVLRTGHVNTETGVSDWLCLTTAKHCDKPQEEEEAEREAAAAAEATAAEAEQRQEPDTDAARRADAVADATAKQEL